MPQLNYYLKQCDEHIDFTVKVSTMGLNSLFGGGSVESSDEAKTERREDGEYVDGYKVATEDDMQWLSQVLGG